MLIAWLPGVAVAAEPLDVVFVLDNSGSMKQNDPDFLTRQAVSNFTDALAQSSELDGRIALVFFDDRARVAQHLTSASDIASTQRLSRTLSSLDFSGQRSNSPAGIERALYELRERGRDEARKAIVFLSDGRIDTGSAQRDVEVARWLREDLAAEGAASAVAIFGIAFTEAADYQLMQALAQRTNARYYRAFTASEIAPVVTQVLGKLGEDSSYALAFADAPKPIAGATPETAPDVAAAPLPEADADAASAPWNRSLLGWVPVALLLVGGALFAQRKGFAPGRILARGSSKNAPPAQLLDLGGQIGEAGKTLPLDALRTTIGRDPHNDVVLEDDTISSEHALIEARDGRYWVTDLRSTNGTRIGDQRLTPDRRSPLKSGDHIRFADVDLMFVLEGYVPGGGTVYLSSSTTPPAGWSMLSESTGPQHAALKTPADDVAFGSKPVAPATPSNPSEAATPADGSLRDENDEVRFAEQRERLDPASVLDLDGEFGPLPTDPESAAQREARPVPGALAASEPRIDEGDILSGEFDRRAIARAEAALAEIEGADASDNTTEPSEPSEPSEGEPARPVLEVVEAAEEPAPAVSEAEVATDAASELEAEVEPEVEAALVPIDLDSTTEIPLASVQNHRQDEVAEAAAVVAPSSELQPCLDYHLARVAEIAPPFATFVERAFTPELREALPVAASELLRAAHLSGRIEEREYTFDRIRFVICGVPAAMNEAGARFVESYGGFTRLLTEHLQADSFRAERCEILAILTFGDTPEPWVSLSIVPDEGQDPRIDLLSYEFLTDREREEIEPSIDPEISQSGLA